MATEAVAKVVLVSRYATTPEIVRTDFCTSRAFFFVQAYRAKQATIEETTTLESQPVEKNFHAARLDIPDIPKSLDTSN